MSYVQGLLYELDPDLAYNRTVSLSISGHQRKQSVEYSQKDKNKHHKKIAYGIHDTNV